MDDDDVRFVERALTEGPGVDGGGWNSTLNRLIDIMEREEEQTLKAKAAFHQFATFVFQYSMCGGGASDRMSPGPKSCRSPSGSMWATLARQERCPSSAAWHFTGWMSRVSQTGCSMKALHHSSLRVIGAPHNLRAHA